MSSTDPGYRVAGGHQGRAIRVLGIRLQRVLSDVWTLGPLPVGGRVSALPWTSTDSNREASHLFPNCFMNSYSVSHLPGYKRGVY